MKKIILMFSCVLFGFTSCISDQELDFSNLQGDPGYFVECYLKPDDIYALSATKIQPIKEDYILDYSLEFKVNVDTVSLIQSLFKEENSNYIYNYGSAERFTPDDAEQVSLTILSPENDTITGWTSVPKRVRIEEASFKEDVVTIRFETSNNPLHNYYIVDVDIHLEEEVKETVRFLDYSHIGEVTMTQYSCQIKTKEEYNEIEVHLKRVTQENYKYQISLVNAGNSNKDNLTFSTPLEGNLKNAMGIFTCYTEDAVTIDIKESNTIKQNIIY